MYSREQEEWKEPEILILHENKNVKPMIKFKEEDLAGNNLH